MTSFGGGTSTGKGTLFCPECDHHSPITGDWTIYSLLESTIYVCPECETTIDSRRDRKTLIAGSGEPLRVPVEN